MNESIFVSRIQLFAMIAHVGKDGVSETARAIVAGYLRSQLNQRHVEQYLKQFDHFLKLYHADKKIVISNTQFIPHEEQIQTIASKINQELTQKDKLIVYMRLLEFVNEDKYFDADEQEFMNTISIAFNMSEMNRNLVHEFILGTFRETENKDKFLIINNKPSPQQTVFSDIGKWFDEHKPSTLQEFRHLRRESMQGELIVLSLDDPAIYFLRYSGSDTIMMNGRQILPEKFYTVDHGAIIRSHKFEPIYFTDIESVFHTSRLNKPISLIAHNLEFHFPKSQNGLHKFNIEMKSGQLIGIMGGSGVGKSTLLSLLNGKLTPANGQVLINGHNVHTETDLLEGVIGFVPQDDLLLEELTVYQNLYFNAKLCFDTLTEFQVNKIITNVLRDLDLLEIKDLKVGNPLNKFISGGQRKRLNISLEVMREPSVMFVDEPTSGLSSVDSEKVMLLLNELTIRGKLIVVNIHQPSSDVFKLFEKIIILDKGGRPIFQGNPVDAINFFKTAANQLNADDAECITCGNVNSEQILQIVESREVDEYGKITSERKVNPDEWYQIYVTEIQDKLPICDCKSIDKTELPRNYFQVPPPAKQFFIFLQRNLLTKISNSQYVLINLFEAPLLAFILAWVTKYSTESGYLLSENKNLPVFLFMGIVVAMFIGLTVSAEEIIRDRRILQRESFLNLSRNSYLISKVVYLMLLSAFQMFTFVVIGNLVVEIHGLMLEHWFILFSVAAWASILGLNLSSGLNSVIAIYISIPFVLVPQLLLGGAMVSFDELHPRMSSKEYVPIIGDLMTSRWAYEAVMVTQFRNNDYNKYFFVYEQQVSEQLFEYSYRIPYLESLLDKLANTPHKFTVTEFNLLSNELNAELHTSADSAIILSNPLTPELHAELNRRLAAESEALKVKKNLIISKRDAKYQEFFDKLGKETFHQLYVNSHNKRVEEIVLNKNSFEKLVIHNDKILRRKDPAYYIAEHPFGRSHMFAPAKTFLGYTIPTYTFNLAFIWLLNFVLLLALHADLLRKATQIGRYLEKKQNRELV